jgi:hypothetical protein
MGVAGCFFLLLLGCLAGCGGGGNGNGSSGSSPVATTAQPSPAREEETEPPAGITFMACEGPQISVYNVNPASGLIDQLGTWNWPYAEEGRVGPTFGCNAGGGAFTVGWLERQQFNRDFTEMAVNDGGVAAVQESGEEMRDVGPPASSGYGARAPAEESVLFRPGTDVVWYADANQENQLFSVNPDAPSAEPTEHSQYSGEEATSSTGEPNPLPFFYFSPDGSLAVTGAPPGFEGGVLMAPSGQFGVGRGLEFVATRHQVLAPFGEAGELRQIPGHADSDSTFCRLQGFVSETAAICSGVTPNVFRVDYTPSFSSFEVSPLLPEAPGVEDDSATVSPDGSEVAFVSQSAAGVALFTVGAEGGEPKEVVDLGGYGASFGSVALLEWR